MTSYNHAFAMAFSVSGSSDPEGGDVTATQLRKALEQRIAALDSEGDCAWIEAVGAPGDTYEEGMPPLVPETVHVHWSESPLFEDNKAYSFVDFETLALQAAVYAGSGGGYDKTKVTVHFTNGFTFDARLDLAMDDTRGFRHYVGQHLSWHRESGRESGDTTALFKRIRWPE